MRPQPAFTTPSILNPVRPASRPSLTPFSNNLRPAARSRAAASPNSIAISMSLLGGRDKSILVFGGGSTLGKEMVAQFIDAQWRVYTLDFYDASVECGGVNGCALPTTAHVPISLALPAAAPARIQVDIARKCLQAACASKFDVVANATLGYATGGIGDDDLFETSEYMYRTSVESSLVAAKLAGLFMAEGGMLSMVGSVAALPGTVAPQLLGFGAAKASVHQMVRLLAGAVGTDLPKGSSVVAVVPEVLDTPLHRSMNDGEVGENWTPCHVVASKLLQWAKAADSRPPNGSLIAVASHRTGAGAEHEDVFRLIQDSSFVESGPL